MSTDLPPILPANMTFNCLHAPTNGSALEDEKSCIKGFYCPFVDIEDPNTIPVYCPPSAECTINRLSFKTCTDGIYDGAQGKYEPIVCEGGYYCPTPKDKFICPSGFHCPTGTFEPIKCDFVAYCPNGSIYQVSYVGIMFMGILDLILLVFIGLRVYFERKQNASVSILPTSVYKPSDNIQSLSEIGKIDIGEKVVKKIESTLSLDVKSRLANNFKRAMDDKKLTMNFKVEDLGFTLPTGQAILQGVNGFIRAGRMTAIMGPSGAGKTTFMNVLCGKITKSSGSIKITGTDVEMSKYKKIIGFVPQDDTMHRELTVRENILHSAQIRLPTNWTTKEIEDHVDTVIEALDLGHVAQSVIGDENSRGVSGGQRKRVNIGIEIAAAPLCVFLDEPTSGLDSTAALEVTSVLDRIARLGVTIVAVIHQPRLEIFKQFDDVLMIAPGGRTAYFGPTETVKNHFENLGFAFTKGSNEADILMDIISGRGINESARFGVAEIIQHWDTFSKAHDLRTEEEKNHSIESANFVALADKLVRERGASFFFQIYYCHNLSLIQQFRNYANLVLELLVATLSGLLMGSSAHGTDEMYIGFFPSPYTVLSSPLFSFGISQIPLLIGIAVALAASPAGVNVFGNELHIYWRKASAGHNTLAYYIGKSLSSFYRIILASLHFSAVFYYLAHPMLPYWVECVQLALVFFGVYSLAAFVSMVVKRDSATLLAVVIALFSATFSGYGLTIKQAKEWGLYFIWCLQFNYWGAEARWTELLKVYEHIYDAELTNRDFEYQLNRTAIDLAAMFLIGVGWRILAYFAMISMNRQKQR